MNHWHGLHLFSKSLSWVLFQDNLCEDASALSPLYLPEEEEGDCSQQHRLALERCVARSIIGDTVRPRRHSCFGI